MAMFVIIVKDEPTVRYYTLNPSFKHLSGVVLCRLSEKILDALKLFELYRFMLYKVQIIFGQLWRFTDVPK